MSHEYIKLIDQKVYIHQDHNEETSCANSSKSFFARSYRKICTVENIGKFCVYTLIGLAGGVFGMLVGNKAIGISYNETSYITMKKSDYVNKLDNSSVVSALVGGVAASTLIFFFVASKFNQEDTNRQKDYQYV